MPKKVDTKKSEDIKKKPFISMISGFCVLVRLTGFEPDNNIKKCSVKSGFFEIRDSWRDRFMINHIF